MSHCAECKPDETSLCTCLCVDCEVAYFQRNLVAALRLPPSTVVFTPEALAALNADEDFVVPVRGRTEHVVVLDDAGFVLQPGDQQDK